MTEEKDSQNKPKIGFIGQGWIGKNYADDFEKREYEVIRYALEEPYVQNRDKIKEADIIFVAVPTPSTPRGFDDSILRKAVEGAGSGSTVVIKSTLLPGTTRSIQKDHGDKYIMHSPEFLTEATASYDAANPIRNIIGIPKDDDEYRRRAEQVLSVLPKADYHLVCSADEAEFIKYGGNNWFYFKVIFFNLLYDLANKYNVDWETIREAMAADPRIGSSHMNPVHKSGTSGGDAHQGCGRERPALKFNELHMTPIHKSGRGAGGHCFIKDFAAFHEMYEKEIGDEPGVKLLEAMRDKNIDLLIKSEKDLDLLKGVYGEDVVEAWDK